MKSKFLIYLFSGFTLISYASTKLNGNATLKSYFKKIESIVLPQPAEVASKSYGSITTCGVSVGPRMMTAVSENWSNPASWPSGVVPAAGASVIIPANKHIILDVATVDLTNLTIDGTLEFARQDISLTAQYIVVMGSLNIGTAAMPFAQKATITLNGTNMTQNIMGMGTRGIMVMGGKLELHGTPPNKTFTKLSNHAAANTTSLSLVDPVSWKVNDQIVAATTDFYEAANGTAQRSQITAINSTSLTIQDGLNAQRWGKLQYLTSTGMSLTSGTLPVNLSPGTPTVLDERAEIANLTRNIVIQSPDDALWQNNGFGCHVMIMKSANTPQGIQGVARLNGVEIKRGGQAGKLGRYPFHWHMLSYEGSTTLPDVTGQYIRNSTINQSAHRGIVIHGTNGAEVSNNVVFDVRGHGIFTEDASERRNTIDGNLVLKVRNPTGNNALKVHETELGFGSSGFWISNPDNKILNNVASDCESFGFWLAFPERTFGASAGIILKPNLMRFGIFNNNSAHSNQGGGIHLDDFEKDELGNLGGGRYTSTTNMQTPQWPYSEVETYELSDYKLWKNNTSGIWNRSNSPRNRRVTSADNINKFFSGASDNVMTGEIDKSLVVGVSLNYNMNGVITPTTYGGDVPPVAFASYHSTFDIKDNVIVGFPAVEGKASGAFALDDYYLIPVDKGSVRNPNNIIINSHPGVRSVPGQTQHVYGVVWDPHNYWGAPASQDNYYVFNNPFFTYGLSQHLPQNNPASGGVVVPGPFYGFDNYYVNNQARTYDKVQAVRTDINGNSVGTWTVEAGQFGDILGNMRHFATHPTGFYYLDFPTIDNVNNFNIQVSNMLTANDYQVLSVKYSGNYQITQLFASTAYNMNEFGNAIPFPSNEPNTRPYAAVANFQAVVNAPTGEVFWHDRANNKVWFKVRGGLNSGDPNIAATNDFNLYKEFKIRAYGSPISGQDTQAPTAPTNLSSANITQTNFVLNWTASTDNIGVTGYDVYRGTTLVGSTTTATTINVTGLVASTAYSMTVRAKDAAGNTATSSALSVTTIAPTSFPIITSRGENLPNEAKERAFDLDNVSKWLDFSATSFLQIQYENAITYNQYVLVSGNDAPERDPVTWTIQGSNNGTTWTTLDSRTGQAWASRNLARTFTFANTTAYSYYKMDITSNTNGSIIQLSELTYGNGTPPADTQAPTVPTNLSSANIAQTSFTLNWAASTDNVAVTGYEVFRDGVSVGISATTSMTVNALTCNTSSIFTVRARDGSGNTSAASAGLSVITAPCSNPCPTLLTLSSTANDYASGTIVKQASASTGAIVATNKVTNTANVTYQAGKSITLNPGFRADAGAVFIAQLGGCN